MSHYILNLCNSSETLHLISNCPLFLFLTFNRNFEADSIQCVTGAHSHNSSAITLVYGARRKRLMFPSTSPPHENVDCNKDSQGSKVELVAALFEKRMFTEEQARSWWGENGSRVCATYWMRSRWILSLICAIVSSFSWCYIWFSLDYSLHYYLPCVVLSASDLFICMHCLRFCMGVNNSTILLIQKGSSDMSCVFSVRHGETVLYDSTPQFQISTVSPSEYSCLSVLQFLLS